MRLSSSKAPYTVFLLIFIAVISCTTSRKAQHSENENEIFVSLKSAQKYQEDIAEINNQIFNQAFEKAIAEGIKVIRIPSGTFPLSCRLRDIKIPSNFSVKGMGKQNTSFIFNPTAKGFQSLGGRAFLVKDATDIMISDLSVLNQGSDNIDTRTFANTVSLLVEDSQHVTIKDCRFNGGHNGIRLNNTTSEYTTNKHINILKCEFFNQASSGLHLVRCSQSLIRDNYFRSCGTDGLKTSKLSKLLKIDSNISEFNRRDGYDFFDGCLESTITNNKAINNALHGFDMKGTPQEDGKYVFKDNIISNNMAIENSESGFALQNLRNCSLYANSSLRNAGSGFYFNNVQNCSFYQLAASENMISGFLLDNVSRTSFTSCTANNNGINQGKSNSILKKGSNIESKSGFYLKDKAQGNLFYSCIAINSTEKGIKTNQEYGFYFERKSANNRIINCNIQGLTKSSISLNKAGIGGNLSSQVIE